MPARGKILFNSGVSRGAGEAMIEAMASIFEEK